MSKIVDYINIRQATIEILKDYHDQLWKIENDPARLEFIESKITSPRGSSMSATPTYGGGNRMEEALCEAIDHKTVIEHGYNQAIRYQREFEPCWQRLSDEERNLLTMRFIDSVNGSGINSIMNKYHVEKTVAYDKSNRALNRLAKLLFW